MAFRASDIVQLERMLNNAATDHELSQQAIKICDRLRNQIRSARHGSRKYSASDLEEERLDFERVVKEIWDRRSDQVLNEYVAHTQIHGGPLDG